MFNLETALATAQTASDWEAIARHLLAANKPKAKRASKKAGGAQTWALTCLEDGRRFLTSHFALATEADTLAAHSDYAQFRARMEDSGDNGHCRTFLNRDIKPVPVASVAFVTGDEIEALRDKCCAERIALIWPNPVSFSIAAE